MKKKHAQGCTFDECSLFCPIRKAEFEEGTRRAVSAALRGTVRELQASGRNTPYFLEVAGWSRGDVERAVRRGDLAWTAAGQLEVVDDDTKDGAK